MTREEACDVRLLRRLTRNLLLENRTYAEGGRSGAHSSGFCSVKAKKQSVNQTLGRFFWPAAERIHQGGLKAINSTPNPLSARGMSF